jgi:hypothetical protein
MEDIKLTFGSLSDYRFALKVKIFDGDDREIQDFKAEKEHTITVEPGIYTIRLELNGILEDHVLRIHQDQRIAFRIPPKGKEWENAILLKIPMIYSSIPFDDENFETYKSSHDYYSMACNAWSQKSTGKKSKKEQQASSSIFVFFRFPSQEQFEKLGEKWSPAFHESFQLYDEHYDLIRSFDERNSIIDNGVGYIAFNMQVHPGTYYIKIFQKGLSRMIPVQVFADWHSQVFMTLGEQPLCGTLRIILSRERKFDSRSVVNKYIDILADKIQNNEAELSTELIKYVTNHKMESPMLALLCIHAYMNGDSDVNDDIIGKMIIVLNKLIFQNNSKSPDIKGIALLAEKYLGETGVGKQELYGVPMLRLGVQAISDAAMQWPTLIGPKGMLDYAIEGLERTSVFTVFEWNESNVLDAFDYKIDIFTETLSDMILKTRGLIQKKSINADQLLEASEALLKKISDQNSFDETGSGVFYKFFSEVRKKIANLKQKRSRGPNQETGPSPDRKVNIKNAMDIKKDIQSTRTAMYVADYVIENPNISIKQVSVDLNIPQPTVERVLTKK